MTRRLCSGNSSFFSYAFSFMSPIPASWRGNGPYSHVMITNDYHTALVSLAFQECFSDWHSLHLNGSRSRRILRDQTYLKHAATYFTYAVTNWWAYWLMFAVLHSRLRSSPPLFGTVPSTTTLLVPVAFWCTPFCLDPSPNIYFPCITCTFQPTAG